MLSPTSRRALLEFFLPTSRSAQLGSFPSSLEAYSPSFVVVLLSIVSRSFQFHNHLFLPSTKPTSPNHHLATTDCLSPSYITINHTPIVFSTRYPMIAPRPLTRSPISAAVKTETSVDSPTNRSPCMFLLLGLRSLSGDILLRQPEDSFPPSPTMRPSPKPPPPANKKNQKRYSTSPILLVLSYDKLLLSFVHLAPMRPSWKPPWRHHDFRFDGPSGLLVPNLISVATMGMGMVFYVLCFFLGWPKDASHVFDVSPHRTFGCLCIWLWTFFHYVATVKAVGTATTSNAASNYQLDAVFRLSCLVLRPSLVELSEH